MNERFSAPKSKLGQPKAEAPKAKKKAAKHYASMLMELEQRIAFDAAGAATIDHVEKQAHGDADAAHADAAPASDDGQEHHALAAALDRSAVPDVAAKAVVEASRQVVFVDSTVENYDELLNGIDGNFEVVILQSDTDGVAQMAHVLAGMKDVEAIHIISHGDTGTLYLGSAKLTAETMAHEYSEALRSLRSVLDQDADILIYGCDFAQGAAGEHAADMLADLTGADVAASDDLTGSADRGGDWMLEYTAGDVSTKLAVIRDAQDHYADLLSTPAVNANGALLVSSGRTIYSVDVQTGKATALTTAPGSVGGVNLSDTINSLAADQANGLIYYTDSDAVTGNKALFAYDYVNRTHILIDSDLTNNGAGLSIVTGSSGVGGGAAAFYNGSLYMGVENVSGSDDQIYRITFTGAGRTIATASTFGAQITAANDWGDFAIDANNNVLLSLNVSTINRYNLATGAIINAVSNVGGAQGGGDINGNSYVVGTAVQQINPTTGAAIGAAITITTNGTTAIPAISDATTWTPQTGSIGDKIFDDNNTNGSFDAGDTGMANVTVQLIDDVNGDGLVSAGDRILATDTTDASGNYLFTNVLPGQYIVRVNDAANVIGAGASTTGGATRSLALSTIGAVNLAADFGYNAQPPIVDLNSGTTPSQIVNNGGTPGTTGWTVAGTGATANDGFAWTNNGSTGTLTQANVSGWNNGYAPSGAAQLTFDFGWSNNTLLGISNDNSTPSTLEISVGGVVYARITTGILGGTPDTATITYFNGASGSPSTVSSSAAGTSAWTRTMVTLNLPSTVAATGDLVFSYSSVGGLLTPGTDDIFIDNVSALTPVDAVAGVNFSTAYTENGVAVSIAGIASDVRDYDSSTIRSATIVLTNAFSGDALNIGALPAGITGTLNTSVAGQITVTLSGTASKADYATAIRAITYSSSSENPSTTARTVNVTVSDGGLTSAVATTTIAITAVNDAPVNALPASGWTTNEDTSLALTGLSIADPDAGTGTMTVVLTVGSGTLTAANGTGVTASGSGTASNTLTGTLAAINTYLGSAAAPLYVPVPDANGAVTLTMTTSDGGNTGTGGTLTDIDTRTITITPVNDAPTLDLDTSAGGTGFSTSYTENGVGIAITNTANATVLVADIDNTNMASATVIVANGQAGDLLAASGALPAGISASYNAATFTLTLSGSATKAAYATALQQIRYSSTSDNPTLGGTIPSRTVNVTVNDGALSSNVAVTTIAVAAVNDAPVNSLPAAGWTTNEDTSVALTGLSVSDPDAGSGTISVTLTVASGTVTAMASGGVTVSGSGSATLTLSGTLAAINTYLASGFAPLYSPAADVNGAVSLTMTTNDGGNFGSGGALSDTDVQTITIVPVNDAPTLDLDASGAGTGFSTTYTENGTGVAIVDTDVLVADIDSASMASALVVIGNAQAGDQLAVAGTLPAGISASYNATTFTLTLSGSATKADYQTALQQVRFLSSSENPSTTPRSISVSVNDGALNSNVALATVNVIAVNDAPVNNVPGPVTVAEDVQTAISGLSVGDVDSGSVSVTLTVVNGTLSPSVLAGAVTGNGTATLTLSGTLAQVNSVLASVRYLGNADFNGADTLTVVTSDGALSDTDTVAITVTPVADIVADSVTTAEDTPISFNAITGTNGASADNFENAGRAVTSVTQPPAGQGAVSFNADGTITYTPGLNFAGTTSFTYTVTSGGATETATVTVFVTPVNDAPVNTLPASGWSTNEDAAIALTGLSVTDVDAASGNISVSLGVGSGILTATAGAGVGVIGSGTSSLTLSGTLAAINAYLASAAVPVFTPAADANGSVTLTMISNDGGNSGAGGPLTDTDTRTITVAAVNDAPVNTLPASYTTNEDVALGLTGLQVSDIDAAGGTVTVVLSVNSGTLSATASPGVTVSGSATATLTLSGTLTDLNAFLASASRPSFAPAADFNGSVTLTMVSNDGGNSGSGGALTDTDTRVITVVPVNDAPVLDLDASGAGSGFATSYTENGTDVAIVDTDVQIVDIDSVNLQSATIVIANPQVGDQLAVAGTLPAGITFTYNAGTFTLTLSGSASKADYHTALQQLRFLSSSDNPDTTIRTINIAVSDGAAASNTAVASVSIIAVNDPPVNTLPAAGWTVAEDSALSLTGLSIADPDAGAGPMTVTLSVGSGTLTATTGAGVIVNGSGTSSITLSGTLTAINSYLASAQRPSFTGLADYNGAVALTMTTSDGTDSDTDSRTITITPVADIVDDTATTSEDTAVIIAVNANDSFENSGHNITAINGAGIVANGVVTVANGAVRLNPDGTLTFTPAADYNGPASFTYTVTSGGTQETATVNVTVTPVNDAPVNTVPGSQTVAEDTAPPLGGVSVSDVDGGLLTTTLTVTQGTISVTPGGGAAIGGNGTATVTLNGTAAQINAALAGLTYSATADYNGSAQLTVQTSDGSLADTDIVAITVTPVADIVADAITTNEDTPINFNVLTGTNGVSADNFENAGRVVTAVTQPPAGRGTVSFSADGTLTYTPAADFNGTTSFTYTVISGGVTETASVTVTVNPVNDAPVNTVPGAQTVAEDTSITFAASSGNAITVNDVDGGVLTVTVSSSNGTFSLSTLAGLSFTNGDGTADATMTFSGTAAAINAALSGASYMPVADYNGPAQISIQTSDGTLTGIDTIAIAITPVVDIASDTAWADEDMSVTISVLANDSFENPGRTITAINGLAIVAGGPSVTVSNGYVQLNAAGQLIFTPATDYNGAVSFTYTVTSGGSTETATVDVSVATVNTPPTNTLPPGFTVLEDTALGLAGLQIADADAGTGIVSVTLSVDSGTLSALSGTGVTVTGSGSASLNLSGTIASINAYLAAASRPSFLPAANAVASVTLTMTTSDNGNTGGPALADIDTATITITPVNDAPAGADKTVTLAEDTVYGFTAADFGFSDPNDSPNNTLASVVITTIPFNGILALGGTAVTAGQVIGVANLASLTWTPAADANGTALASFTFQVRDNGGTADGGQNTDPTPNSFTFNVTAVNDAPVNTLPATFSTSEDTTLALTGLQISDVDAGAGAMTITLSVNTGTLSATAGSGVAVVGSGSGTLTLSGTLASLNAYLASVARPSFVPVADFHGAVTLTMTTSDSGNSGAGGTLTDSDTAAITVTSINDAPVGSNASISTSEDSAVSGTLPVATDVDGDSLTYGAGGTSPAHGMVVVNANGTYTYTPAANYNGTDTFSYTVSDGMATVEYTVTVTISAVNDAPVGVNDSGQTDAGTSTSVNVLANDTDIDGDTLAVSQVNGLTANVGAAVAGSNGGTFTIGANGVAQFSPGTAFADLAAGQQRTTSVSYQVADGHGGFSTATFTMTVTGVDDAPVSTPIAAQTANDAQFVSFNISGNFSDPDTGDTLAYTATGLPPNLMLDPATGIIAGTIDRSASQTGPYSVTITATDGSGLQTSRTFTWTVLNPAPIARDDALATTENAVLTGSLLANNGNGIDSDPDGDPIVVSAVGGSPAGVGTAVAGSNGGTFTINANGSYSFNPNTSFDNLAAGQTRTTTVSYTISDGQGGFSTAIATVTVTGQNDAPVATADNFTTNEDAAVTFDVRTNDSDVDGGTLSVTQIDNQAISAGNSVTVTGGTVTLNLNGTLTFAPALNYNGTPSFTYTLSDGQGATSSATVTGTVNAVQDPPVAVADSFVTNEDMPITFDVRTNDSDPDGDLLTVTQINNASIAPGGSVSITGGIVTLNVNGTLTFTPNANYNGSPAFSYTISDGQGGTASATVSGTVTPVQDAPIAGQDSFVTNEDTSVIVAVLANDSDPDGDPLTITRVDNQAITAGNSVAVTGGTVTLNANGTLTFSPALNYNGAPSFSYTVSDGQGNSTTATVNGTVTPVNDAPVAADDAFSTSEDVAATFDVRTNDSDVENNLLSVVQINGSNIAANGSVLVAGGSVKLNADGTLTFMPNADYNGQPSFTYTVSDGQGGLSTATVRGTVLAVNDAPIAVSDSFVTSEDAAATFDVRANDTDVDGDALTVTAINGNAILPGGWVSVTGGTVMLNANGTLTFMPAANYNGSPSFTYTLSDGTTTVTGTVNGTVTPVNDAPVSAGATVSVLEDGTLTGTLPAATDVDGDTITYAAGTTRPASGAVIVNPDGSYSYVPNANFFGTDSFSFTVSDGHGGSGEYTIIVNVGAVNDAPVGDPLPAQSYADSSLVSVNVASYFSDIDGDTLTYTQTGLPAGLGISPAGVISGTLDRQASQGGPLNNGVYSVTVSVSDGHGGTTSQTFSLTATNPAPTTVGDVATTAEDTPVTLNVLNGAASGGTPDSDPDGDPLTVTAASAAHGSVTIGTNGQITYQPNTNFNGSDTIVYTISDGNGGTATGSVTVTVTPVNDAPVAGVIADRTRNDGDLDSINTSAFFTDADGDTLSYSATGLPPGLTINTTTGVISGTLTAGASGATGERTYAITVTANDGHGASTPLSFNYTVLNLPPVANDDGAPGALIITAEDTPININVLGNDTDPDGDISTIIRVNNVALSVGGSVASANGTVSLIMVGTQPTLRFSPNANYNGQESFTYSIDDGNGGVDTATVTVTVTPVNDSPAGTRPIPDRVRADGEAFSYNVADFFTDPEGDVLNFVITGMPAGLSYNPATGAISGTIDHNASRGGAAGVYTVTITAYDRPGATGASTVQTFNLTVTNPGPVANNDTVTVNEDTQISFNVLTGADTTSGAAGADTDPDGDSLTVTAAEAGHGTVSIGPGGVLTYTPNADFFGSDTIVYTIGDGDGGVSTATVTVTVLSVNDAPTAIPIPDQIDSDSEVISYDASGYFDDVDGDTLTYSATGLPTGLSIDPNTGLISGTLDNNASAGGPYAGTITASDGHGGTVSQNITWVISNLPPKAFSDTLFVQENDLDGGNVLTNDHDPDNDPLSVDAVNGSAANLGQPVAGSNGGTFVINSDGTYSFDPGTAFDDLQLGETRTTTITYGITDGQNRDTATVTVTVNGVNDAPTAAPIPSYTAADGQSLTANPLDVSAFFTDAESDTLTFSATGLPSGLTMDASGVIRGTIDSNASVTGPYTVIVTASDGTLSANQAFTFNVTNPAPTAVNDTATTTEDTAIASIDVIGNDTDPDGDTLTVDPAFPPQAGHGTVTINGDGTLRYVPDANFNGFDTIVYRVTDGQGGVSTGIVTVNVGATNDAPVATPIADTQRNDGDVVSFDISGNFSDPEGNPLTYSATGLPPGLTINPTTGVISGRIDPGASGPNGSSSYLVTVTASDNFGGDSSSQFTYTVNNLAPEANNDVATTFEDTPVDIAVLANDIDPDGDTDGVIAVNGVPLTVDGASVATANGSVRLVTSGNTIVLRFTPASNYVGTESFVYTVNDGNGGIDTASVTITIAAVNDAPVAMTIPDRSQVDGSVVSLSAADFFTDADGDDLDFVVTGLPPGLSYDAETGVISGALAANASQTSPYTVTVTANDRNGGGGLSASTSFLFTVTNPVPVAANDVVLATEDTISDPFNPITGVGTVGGLGGAGADIDPDGDTLTIVEIAGQPIAVNGTVTVANGTMRLDAGGMLTFTPAANFNGSTVIAYRISDGNGGFSDATITLTVAAVNDAPTLDLNATTPGTGNSVIFNEGDSPVAVASGDAIAFDVEGTITSLDVTLTGFQNGASEVVHLNGSVDLVYGTVSGGVITFGGTDFVYAYDGANALRVENAASATDPMPNAALSALIRAVQYENRSTNPTIGSRTFAFTLTDDLGATSASAVATVTVGAINSLPTAVNDTVTTGENTPLLGTAPGVLANDSDPEGASLIVTDVNGQAAGVAVTGSAGGSFVVNADGSYSFDPLTGFDTLKAGETSSTFVTYTVSDGAGGTATATLTVVVTGVNDAPVGAGTSISVAEDLPTSGTLPVATDVDGDTLTYAAVTQPAHGSVSVAANGSYTYSPAADYNGADSFTYSVSDGTTSSTYTVTVNVAAVQDAPVGTDIADQALTEAQVVSFDASAYFSDIDGDALSYSQTGLPAGLAIDPATGLITGSVSNMASQINGGVYTVTITANDGHGNVISESFGITVTNPAPTARDDAATTSENAAISGSVLANNGNGADSDPDGDLLAVSAVNGLPANVGMPVAGSAGGSFTIRADGSYSFEPGTDFDGLKIGQSRTTNILYTISDGQGGTSTATVTITVTGQNDAPVGAAVTLAAQEDTVLNGTLPVATDADGDVLSYGVGLPPTHGTLTVNPNGSYSYVPNADFNGSDSFSYTVTDGITTVSYTATVNVGAVNDAPTVQNSTPTTLEDTPFNGQILAADVDNLPAELSYTLQTAPAHGVVVLNADGSYTYTPAANFNGTDTFSVQVQDPGGASAVANVTISVGAVNDLPVAVNDSATTTENTAVSGNVILDAPGRDSDVDGDSLSVVGVNAATGGVGMAITGSNGGSFTILADGSYTFDPGADFDNLPTGQPRVTTVTYTISDGHGGSASATLTVTVTGLNDVPTAPALAAQSGTDGASFTFNAGTGFSDPDGDPLTYTITGLPADLIYDSATGAITGTLARDASGPTGNGTYTINVSATDGNGGTVSRSFVLTVSNPGPVAMNDDLSMLEDGILTGSVLVANGHGADNDPDADPLTASVLSGTAHGTLVLNVNGTFTYTPVANFNGIDSFVYQISDGNGGTAMATVTISVGAVNDAPVILGDSFVVAEDGTVTIAALQNDSDIDGNTLSVTQIDGVPIAIGATVTVTGGTVTLNADQTLTFVAATDFTGIPSFSYTASDGVFSAQASVSGTIQAVNDAPVNSLPPTFNGIEDTPLALNGLSISDVDAGTGTISVTLSVGAGTLTAVPGAGVTISGSGSATVTLTGTLAGINAYLGAHAPIYTPVADSNAPVTLTMVSNDGGNTGTGGALGDSDQATILLQPVNDAPVAADASLSTTEDMPVAGMINATDVDGDVLTYAVTAQPANGIVTLDANGRYVYAPAGNFSGTDAFQITVTDGNGGSRIVTVTVAVAPVDDAPVGSDTAITVTEDIPASGSLPAATDPEGNPVFYAVASQPAHGSVTVSAAGLYSYTPDPNYNGADSFTYTVSDGAIPSTYTVFVTVAAVDDAPVGADATINADQGTPFNGTLPPVTDVDGDTITYAAGLQPAHGTVVVNPDGTFVFTADNTYVGADSFTYTITDGTTTLTYTVTVNVADVDFAPVGANATIAVEQGRPSSGMLPVATDADGDAITYAAGTPPAHGTLVVNPDGSYVFTADPNYVGTDSFSYTVSDGANISAYTITVNVGDVNYAPVGSDATIAVDQGTPSRGTLPVATDFDGDTITYGIGTQPAHGTLVVKPNGTYIFTADQSYVGLDSFSYTISDGTVTLTYTITVDVADVNFAPVGSNGAITVVNGQPTSGSLPTATDADGDPITYGVGTPPVHGTLVINPDGTYLLTPDPDYVGSDGFTYTVTDGTVTVTYSVALRFRAADDVYPLEVDPPMIFASDDEGSGDLRRSPVDFFDDEGDDVADGATISDAIGDLNSISDDIGAFGPVSGVINAAKSLNGIGGLPDSDAVLYSVRQMGDWTDSTRRIDDLTAGFFQGGSNVHAAEANDRSTWFTVDTIVNEGLIYIMASTRGGTTDSEFSVTLADGRALPDWLRRTDQGLVIGQPPAGLAFIDIRIQGATDEGVISDTVRIDLMTGAIIDHTSDDRASTDAALFSDRINTVLTGGEREAAALSRALAEWAGIGG